MLFRLMLQQIFQSADVHITEQMFSKSLNLQQDGASTG